MNPPVPALLARLRATAPGRLCAPRAAGVLRNWLAFVALAAGGLASAQTIPTPTTAPSVVAGRGWHVDAVAGDDTNPGTAEAPFRSLARVSQVVLARGDAILLRCGSVFRESLRITPTQAPMGLPTVGAYGACKSSNRPLIDGTDRLQARWTLDPAFGGLPVYSTTWNSPVRTLYWNGAPMVKARFPNYGGIGNEFAIVQAPSAPDAFVLRPDDASALASAGVDLTGLELKMRTKGFVIEPFKVRGFDPATGVVSMDSVPRYQAPRAGTGFYLQGSPRLLDAPGEWFWDAATGKLSVWTWNGLPPDAGLLETVARTTGLEVFSVADARIEKLAFDRHGDASLLFTGALRPIVSEVFSRRADGTAIRLNRWTYDGAGALLQDVEIAEAGSSSLNVSTPDATVTRSLIRDSGMGSRGAGDWSAAVKLNGDGARFIENLVLRVAAVGINVGPVAGAEIRGNEIARACARLTDCGALYAWGKPTSTLRKSITANYVHDLVPNWEGAVGGAPKLVVGLYLDHHTRYFDLVGNMIVRIGVDAATGQPVGEGMGIHVQSSAYNTFVRNKVWLVTKASLHMQSSFDPDGDLLRGNVATENLLYGGTYQAPLAGGRLKTMPVYAQAFFHRDDPWRVFSGADPNRSTGNYYATLNGPAGKYWLLYSPGGAVAMTQTDWLGFGGDEKMLLPYSAVQLDASFVQGRESTMLANPSSQWKSIRCSNTVLRNCNVTNLSGGAVTWPVILAPRSSLVVVSADTSWALLR